MATTTLSISSLLTAGWELTKKRYVSLFVLLGIVIVGMVVQQAVVGLEIPLLSTILNWVVSTVVSVATTLGLLQIVRGQEKLDFSKVWEEPKVLLNMFLTNLLLGLMVVVGLLLLIVPGIYLALRYGMASILVVDEDLGPMEALQRSSKITEGKRLFILTFGIASVAVNILGALALGVGLLISIPVTSLAGILLYERLKA